METASAASKPSVRTAATSSTAAQKSTTTTTAAKPLQTGSRGSSRLSLVTKTKLVETPKIFIFGPEGVGKTSLGADAPDPIFFDIDAGSGQQVVARYPFEVDPENFVPSSFKQVMSALDDLTKSPHDFKSLVIDTVDKLETLVWQHVCEANSGNGKSYKSIEDFGYGKGYVLALDTWRSFANALDALRVFRGVMPILLGHAQIKLFKSPDSEDFDRYTPKMNEKSAGFWKEWSDILGYATFEIGVTVEEGKKNKGFSTGRRVLHFEREAAFDAKTRYSMPKEVELESEHPWAPFAKAIADSQITDPAQLVKLIDLELDRIGDEELTKKVNDAKKNAVQAENSALLSKFLNRLKTK